MHRTLLSLLVLTALAVPASGQTVLDMSVDPVSVNWDLIDEGTGATGSLAGGILEINCPSATAFYGYRAPMADWGAASIAGQWAVEARVHLIEQAVTNNPARGALHLSAGDGARYFLFVIHPDKIEFYEAGGSGPYGGTWSYAMDTTDGFHVYRMEVDGPLVDVYVDGTLVMSASNNGSSVANVFAFGDLLYENSSSSQWDYVSFEGTSVVSGDESSWSEVKSQYQDSNR